MPETEVERRLGELVLYIAARSVGDKNFGTTKLLKLLAHADFLSYERTGKPLTGATYRKLDYGPAPAEFPQTLNLLRARRRLRTEDADVIDYSQTKIVPLDEPNPTAFTVDELSLVDEVLERFRSMNAREISDDSHRHFVGWHVVGEMQEIPYRSVYMTAEPPTAEDLAWAEAEGRRLGLARS